MTSLQVCRVIDLSFSFTTSEPLISGLSFNLHLGQKIALVGPNGCGKTTLLKIIDSQIDAEGECVVTTNRHFVGQFDGDLLLSRGEAKQAVLRAALFSHIELVLLDEPTNDLDAENKAWLLKCLIDFEGALLIVSHDPVILDIVDEIWELKNGQIIKHPHGFENFVSRLNSEEASLEQKIASLESEADKRERMARTAIERQQKRSIRGHKSGIKQNLPKIVRGAKKRQAQNTLAKVKSVHESRVEDNKQLVIEAQKKLREMSMFKWDASVTRPPSAKRVCAVENFALSKHDHAISFLLTGPSRIHLKGANGSGKSTLLKALAQDSNALKRCIGKFYLGVPYCLFDQRLSQFDSNEELWQWFQRKLEWDVAKSRQLLGRLGFEQDEQSRPMKELSGGEKIRIELAVCVNQKTSPQLLLLDEPTNHLDLTSRKILVKFLKQFEGALIVVSHDAYFLSVLEFDQVVEL